MLSSTGAWTPAPARKMTVHHASMWDVPDIARVWILSLVPSITSHAARPVTRTNVDMQPAADCVEIIDDVSLIDDSMRSQPGTAYKRLESFSIEPGNRHAGSPSVVVHANEGKAFACLDHIA